MFCVPIHFRCVAEATHLRASGHPMGGRRIAREKQGRRGRRRDAERRPVCGLLWGQRRACCWVRAGTTKRAAREENWGRVQETEYMYARSRTAREHAHRPTTSRANQPSEWAQATPASARAAFVAASPVRVSWAGLARRTRSLAHAGTRRDQACTSYTYTCTETRDACVYADFPRPHTSGRPGRSEALVSERTQNTQTAQPRKARRRRPPGPSSALAGDAAPCVSAFLESSRCSPVPRLALVVCLRALLARLLPAVRFSSLPLPSWSLVPPWVLAARSFLLSSFLSFLRQIATAARPFPTLPRSLAPSFPLSLGLPLSAPTPPNSAAATHDGRDPEKKKKKGGKPRPSDRIPSAASSSARFHDKTRCIMTA